MPFTLADRPLVRTSPRTMLSGPPNVFAFLLRRPSADPEALAARLFGWELHSEWETFYGAATTYADVLGEGGLAVFRKVAEEVWARVPAIEPG
jgi:hypothetical protein